MARPKKLANRKSKKDKKLIKETRLSKIPVIRALESEILKGVGTSLIENTADAPDAPETPEAPSRDMLEQIMFKLPCVKEPLMGSPKQVKRELDSLAIEMQNIEKQQNPDEEEMNKIFNKIHLYMHGYLINVCLKKFPFIKGLQTVDIYQETLIALKIKAIPNFKRGKGMSFLNFAKMCIRRHLITLLNASKNRKKDQSINQAISLDSSPIGKNDDDEHKTTYANIIADNKASCDETLEKNEAYIVTKTTLLNALSSFERVVLKEYLSSSSYREISKNISISLDRRYNTKSIDNALLRIRKKAMHLFEYGKIEDLPIFLPKSV